MKYYPLIVFGCWIIPSVHRLINLFGVEGGFLIVLLHGIGDASTGFLNACMYGLTPEVFKTNIAFFCPENKEELEDRMKAKRQASRDFEEAQRSQKTPKCENEHYMQLMMPASIPVDYNQGVRCDICGQYRLEENEYFYHCKECSYDLCDMCDGKDGISEQPTELLGGVDIMATEESADKEPRDVEAGAEMDSRE